MPYEDVEKSYGALYREERDISDEEKLNESTSLDARYSIYDITPRQLIEIGAKKTSIGDVKSNSGVARNIAERIMNHYIRLYAGDKTQALAAYYSSPETVNEAIAKSESKENKEGKSWLDYIPKDVQKTVADVRSWGEKREQARHDVLFGTRPYKETNFFDEVDEDELREVVLETDPKAKDNPDYCNMVVKAALNAQKDKRKAFRDNQLIVLRRAYKALEDSGGDPYSIDEEDWSKLDSISHKDVLKKIDEIRGGMRQLNVFDADVFTAESLSAMDYPTMMAKAAGLYKSDGELLCTNWFNVHKAEYDKQKQQQYLSDMAEQGYLIPGYNVHRDNVKGALRSLVPGYIDFEKKDPQAAETYAWVAQLKLHRHYQSQGDQQSTKDPDVIRQDLARLIGNGYLNFRDPEGSPFKYTWKTLPDTGNSGIKNVIKALAQRANGTKNVTEDQCNYEWFSLLFDPTAPLPFDETIPIDKKRKEAIQDEAKRTRGEELQGGIFLLEYALRDLGLKSSTLPGLKVDLSNEFSVGSDLPGTD